MQFTQVYYCWIEAKKIVRLFAQAHKKKKMAKDDEKKKKN